MPTIAVLDYGIGNLRSAQKALERAGADAVLTSQAKVIKEAAGVVLPGVGNFGTCVEALRTTGLDRVALDAIPSRRPFLGTCLGLQLLFEGSEESPNHQGLGVLSGEVRILPESVKRPQMQWNAIHVRKDSQILKGLDRKWLYFVHSYAVDLSPNNEIVAATCSYGNDVVAAVQSENVFATQFHPEKSSDVGKEFLVNFVNSCKGV